MTHDQRFPRVILENGAELACCLVPSSGFDFGCASMRANGLDASIYPINADQCERIAAMFADLAIKLRAAEADRAKLRAALAADEVQA